jgi:beta-galactosidase
VTESRVELTTSHDHFLRNGVPHQIISGALHYFRIPHPLWEDRLLRVKAMGCNTVETYVPWNFHQPYAGRPADFTGMRDLGRFLDLAASLDLDIVVRPGPYICAEWDNGGLPAWLLADHRAAAALRTSDPAYLDHVDRWFDQLLPIIVRRQADRGGRVIGVQVENEYGSFGNDHRYLEHLLGAALHLRRPQRTHAVRRNAPRHVRHDQLRLPAAGGVRAVASDPARHAGNVHGVLERLVRSLRRAASHARR